MKKNQKGNKFVQIHLFFVSKNFARIYVIFIIVLAITNRKCYPKKSDIRSHMYHATVKYRLATRDQENRALKVEQWKLEYLNDILFFRPYGQHCKGKCHSFEIN